MDELWERAVETAIDGQTKDSPVKNLTLDGAVKCYTGRLPPPTLLEKFQSLEHLSIASVGLTSLEKFPRLWNLQKLILSDNRISGGLEFLVEAGLRSLRDLDLSNNRIQDVDDLKPLAQLDLVSLDLYECPVTRVKDYRVRVFGLIKSLKYLDKLDADENDEDEEEEEEEEEDDDDEEDVEEEEDEEEDEDGDDGEIDGVDLGKNSSGGGNGASGSGDGVIDVDDDEEIAEDGVEEEMDELRLVNGSNGVLHSNVNGYIAVHRDGDVEDEDDDDDDDDYSEELEGVDEDEEESVSDDEDVVEVHEIEDSDEEEEGVEDEDSDEDEEEAEHVVSGSSGRVMCNGGEIDGHELGEEDSDNDGEYEEDDGEDEASDFLIRPVGQAEHNGEGSALDPENEIDDGEAREEIDEEKYLNRETSPQRASSSQVHLKRKRQENDIDGNGDDDDDDSDSVEDGSLKPH